MTSSMTSSKASNFDISVKNIYRHPNFSKVVYWTRGQTNLVALVASQAGAVLNPVHLSSDSHNATIATTRMLKYILSCAEFNSDESTIMLFNALKLLDYFSNFSQFPFCKFSVPVLKILRFCKFSVAVSQSLRFANSQRLPSTNSPFLAPFHFENYSSFV